MKRILLSIVLITSVLAVSNAALAVPYYGEFPWWYSDDYRIGSLANSANTIGISRTAGCPMTDAKLTQYTSTGVSAWNLSGYSFSYLPGSTTGTLNIQCISRAEANSLGLSGTAAAVTFISGTFIATASYVGTTKNIYSTTYFTYYIWDTNNTANYGDANWINVAAHEHGHGIGFYGHNQYASSQLMWPTVTGVTVPGTTDKRHMSNLYTIN
jgi:hypothetical protein